MDLKDFRKEKMKKAKREPLHLKQMHKCLLKIELNNGYYEFNLPSEWHFTKLELEDGSEAIGSYIEVLINEKELFKIYLNYWSQKVFISDIEYFADKDKSEYEYFSVEEQTPNVDIIFYQFSEDGFIKNKDGEFIEAKLMLSTKYNTTLYSEKNPNKTLKISLI